MLELLKLLDADKAFLLKQTVFRISFFLSFSLWFTICNYIFLYESAPNFDWMVWGRDFSSSDNKGSSEPGNTNRLCIR